MQAHLDVMFDPSAEPLAWDSGNAYTRDRLEVYYMSYAATPLPLDKLTEVSFPSFFGSELQSNLKLSLRW